MNDILVIWAPFLMKKEDMKKTYDVILNQMKSGLVMLPAGFSVALCPKDVEVKFVDSNSERTGARVRKENEGCGMTNEEAYRLLDEIWELLFQEMRNSTFKDIQESGKLNEYMKAHNMALLALKKESNYD